MGVEVLSKCGYRCDLCLAYAPNVERDDRRQELSDGWYAIYGFRIEPEDIFCEGCVSSESPVLIDANCPVRPCVVEKGIANCAYCPEFVCEKHKQRGVDRLDMEEKLGRKLNEYEYETFVLPYEAEARIWKLKAELGSAPGD